MNYEKDFLLSLVNKPKETLDIELKTWIDPSSKEGMAKIAAGCIAMRNNNGGFLLDFGQNE